MIDVTNPRAWLLAAVLAPATLAAAEPAPWESAPHYAAIAARLDRVMAIDHHTHLLDAGRFVPAFDRFQPVMLRSTWPAYAAAVRERFGIALDPARAADGEAAARKVRDERLAARGATAYWNAHLDATRTAIALVNQVDPAGTDRARLRWVAMGTPLLHPFDPASLAAANPGFAEELPQVHRQALAILGSLGVREAPTTLDAYKLALVRILRQWKEDGAVGVKFYDAYFRSIRFDEVPGVVAAALWDRARAEPLSRVDYWRLQDHLARFLFLEAGRVGLPVHVHSSHGVPPWLQLRDADVRNLEPILTDPRFLGTNFVLIHGGAPLHEEAAYLALKENVWVDLSAMSFLYPVPDYARVLRQYLLFAPEKLLYATDVGNYPGVPVGPEVQHVAISRSSRAALYLALAGLVGDGVLTLDQAVAFGEGVLAGNAKRLYGFE